MSSIEPKQVVHDLIGELIDDRDFRDTVKAGLQADKNYVRRILSERLIEQAGLSDAEASQHVNDLALDWEKFRDDALRCFWICYPPDDQSLS